MSRTVTRKPINNVVVISDTHCGCRLALCPPEVSLDEGGDYKHSKLQAAIWAWWQEFWGEWVPMATRGEPFAVVHNGDAIDGNHHDSVSQISHNMVDQSRIAYEVLKPVVEACEGRYYHIRGTEAHVGKSGQAEEALAEKLGARPNEEGQFARYELWLRVGGGLAHIMHHIGTTGSAAYETTALMKEFAESCAEAARWGQAAPNVVVRSHRHRNAEIKVPTADTYGICCTTAGWQLKTPFVWKLPGGRVTTPQIGGTLIRYGDEDHSYTRHKIWNIARSKEEVCHA
jgi:hypothetical protein